MSVFSPKDYLQTRSFASMQSGHPRGIGVVSGAGINEAGILEGHAQIPAIPPEPSCVVPANRLHPAASGAARNRVRLLPLEGFVWGSPSQQPRVRAEHSLIWVTKGRMRLDLPHRPGLVPAGNLRWLLPGTAFAARAEDVARGHVLLIRPDPFFVPCGLPRHAIAASVGSHDAQLLAILRDMQQMARQDRPPAALARMLDLLLRVIAELEPQRPEAGADLMPLAESDLVERFEALADREFHPMMTVADLAQMLGCGTAALDRATMDQRGKRALAILNDIRLHRAITLLRDTPLSVTRIAEETGFASHAHFARVFSAATGQRPETFRAQSR